MAGAATAEVGVTGNPRVAIAEINTTPDGSPDGQLAPPIAALLATVRRRIRRYLWAEGLAAIAAALIAAFWLTLVFDWFFEPPAAVRVLVLAGVGGAVLWIGHHLLVDRLRVRLANRSLALLIERRYPWFDDSLLTAVEYTDIPRPASPYERQMVASAVEQAIGRIEGVDPDEIFNPAPLARNVLLAAALGIGAIGYALFEPRAVETWARRMLTLSNELWPRYTRLVIDGFEHGSIKVARGSDVELIVKADMSKVVPRTVRVQYRTDEGLRGRATMIQRGKAIPGRDQFQQFSYSFEGILTPITFDVVGGDDRRGNLRIEVVDSPAITGMTLRCRYPAYMHREERAIPVTGAMRIPQGTGISVDFTTNKDMLEVEISDSASGGSLQPAGQSPQSASIRVTGDVPPRQFHYEIGRLDGDRTLLITLLDTDRIRNREPNRLAVSAVADETPQIDVRLRGIGSAITPQAQLPVIGEMKDDYGIARTWFELAVDGQAPHRQELSRPPRENTELAVDEAFDVRPRGLNPGQKVTLAVKAEDTFALSEAPQQGTSSVFALDIVTADELRSMLESRELNLRRRFEQLISEVGETRDGLARLEPGAEDAAEPAADDENLPDNQQDEATDPTGAGSEGAAKGADRRLARARLRVEQALQNSRKNADETLGVAVAFEDIHDELVNNRVDTEELKSRLKQGIAEPLRRIAGTGFGELETRLAALQNNLAEPAERAARLAAARQQADSILFEMQQVLSKMIELETFNEVVDLLRSIIDSQQGLNAKTKESRKSKLRDLIQ